MHVDVGRKISITDVGRQAFGWKNKQDVSSVAESKDDFKNT